MHKFDNIIRLKVHFKIHNITDPIVKIFGDTQTAFENFLSEIYETIDVCDTCKSNFLYDHCERFNSLQDLLQNTGTAENNSSPPQ